MELWASEQNYGITVTEKATAHATFKFSADVRT